ncbi:MAG: hypothetical protein ACQERC_06545 [Bacteroidota bacterium]
MKFMSLQILAKTLGVSADLSRDDAIADLRAAASDYFQRRQTLEVDGVVVEEGELAMFLVTHEDPEKVVFNEWVCQDATLYEYIVRGEDSLTGKDVQFNRHEGHTLESAYKSYLTPFLSALIQNGRRKWNLEQSLSALIIHARAVDLVAADVRGGMYGDLVQTVPIDAAGKKEWQWIEEQLENGMLIDFLNALDNEVYSAKIKLVERVKRTISSESNLLRRRKMMQELLRLRLNKNHKDQLELWAASNYSPESGRAALNGRNPLVYGVGLTLFVIVGLFFWYPRESENQHTPDENSANANRVSGLDSLDQEGIRTADSLLGYQSDTTEDYEYEGLPVYNPVKNTMIRADLDIENECIQQLRESMLNDYEIRSAFSSDCQAMKKSALHSFQFDSVRPSDALRGDEHEVHNDSEKDVFVLQYEPRKEGAVWGAFFPAGTKRTIQLREGHHILLYTGNDLARFNPVKFKNQGYGNVDDARKITAQFTAHFCEFDLFDVQLLNRIYKVENTTGLTTLASEANGLVTVRSAAIKRAQ